MANTENIEAKLAAYVDGELDAAGRAEIEQYLTTNPQHRELIDELRQAKNYLQELPRAAAPMEVAEMISQQLERASLLGDVEIGEGGTHFARWPQFRAIAAILLLTVGLAGVLYYVLPSPKPVAPHAAVITPDMPPDDAMEMARARRAGPSVAAADSTETNESRLGAAGASPPRTENNGLASLAERSNAGRMVGGGGAGGNVAAPSGALYLTINTPDPATANTQVINYFASNRISYEQVAATDTPLPENKTITDPAATTRPEFDNVAPGAAAPSATANAPVAAEPLKDSAMSSTSPADKLEVAKSVASESAQKQQSFACYKAKMTREEAATLSQTLSQPQMRQVAQIVPQDYGQQQRIQTKADSDDEVARREKSPALQQQELQKEQQQQQPAQASSQSAAPMTNEASPATGQDQQPATMPAYADRAGQGRSEVLAAGDNIRIRMDDPARAGSQPHVETQVIDEEGYVTLPNVGRVKAAGLTPDQLSSNVIPQAQEKNRDAQSANVHLAYSIEKIAPESNIVTDQKFPATQEAGGLAMGVPPAEKPEPAPGPTTHPTTNPTDLAAGGIALAPSEQEKIDVVVIVQNAEGPTTAPSAAVPETPTDRRAAESVLPSTQPAITSPTTAPTTLPTR